MLASTASGGSDRVTPRCRGGAGPPVPRRRAGRAGRRSRPRRRTPQCRHALGAQCEPSAASVPRRRARARRRSPTRTAGPSGSTLERRPSTSVTVTTRSTADDARVGDHPGDRGDHLGAERRPQVDPAVSGRPALRRCARRRATTSGRPRQRQPVGPGRRRRAGWTGGVLPRRRRRPSRVEQHDGGAERGGQASGAGSSGHAVIVGGAGARSTGAAGQLCGRHCRAPGCGRLATSRRGGLRGVARACARRDGAGRGAEQGRRSARLRVRPVRTGRLRASSTRSPDLRPSADEDQDGVDLRSGPSTCPRGRYRSGRRHGARGADQLVGADNRDAGPADGSALTRAPRGARRKDVPWPS